MIQLFCLYAIRPNYLLFKRSQICSKMDINEITYAINGAVFEVSRGRRVGRVFVCELLCVSVAETKIFAPLAAFAVENNLT